MIAAFPTCVRCHGSHSELNASGKCVVCHAQELQQTYESADTRLSTSPDHVRPTRTRNPDVASRDPDDRTWQPGDPVPSYLQLAGYGPMTYLAKGGMGFVFVAEYKSLRRRCAIKMMNPIASLDPRQKHRFETEAMALARLQHPGIVQVFDFGRHNEIGYLSLELVTGGSLARRLTETPALTYTQIADLTKQVASAVAAAHALGILHRDLKPANILLDHLGRAKVTDFGLASLHDASVNLTETGAMIGTPAYMSPEQAAGQFHLVSERSDVYAIGATLYEMITGSPPFKAESAVATASRVIHDVPVPPRSIARDCPRDLETICLRCLEKDPARRYATAADLANELSRFLRGEPVERPSWAQRARKTIRKYRVAASVLLCLALGGAGYFALIPDEPQVAMRKRIERGLPVTLVGERGKPAYAIDRLGINPVPVTGRQRFEPTRKPCWNCARIR
jgi:serine/threonine-protein kinase